MFTRIKFGLFCEREVLLFSLKISRNVAVLLCTLAISAQADPNADFSRGVDSYTAGNYPAAIANFRKASAFAHHGAQFNLGLMFETGTGVPLDNVTAYMWYEISIGNTGKRALRRKRHVAAKLSSPERLLAQRRAIICVDSNYQTCD